MYHTKRRHSATNRFIKYCKRILNALVLSIQEKIHSNTSVDMNIFVRFLRIIYLKLVSLGTHGIAKIAFSMVSIFVFIFVVVSVSGRQKTISFADNSLKIKEVDDAYISLDGAILDDDGADFGGRFVYLVKPGDTLDSIAREFGVTENSLKQSNGLQTTVLKQGQELVISNVEGFIYTTKGRIAVRDFASQYRLDLQDLKELNSLQNDNDVLESGDEVFVPLTMDEGKKLGLIAPDPEPVVEPQPAPKPATKPTTPVKTPTTPAKPAPKPTTKPTTPVKTPSKSSGGIWRVSQTRAGCFGFVPGQCTCYAAQQRPDIFVPGRASPWRGNAKAWYNNAKSAGYSVGTKPAMGAIAVMSYGWGGYGHVGIVIGISDDEVLIRSMNYIGPYIVSDNWISTSRIRGYIY